MRSSSKGSKRPDTSNNPNQPLDKKLTGIPVKNTSKTKTTGLRQQKQVKVPSEKIVKPIGTGIRIPKDVKPPQIFPKISKKKEVMKQPKWGNLPYSCFATICSYYCSSILEIYQLSKVCSSWRNHLMSETGCYLWNYMKGAQNIANFNQLRLFLRKLICDEQEKMSFEYEKQFTKLFNYGSTKQNIPNKIIDKLNLEIEMKLNEKTFMQPFKLRTFNFASYLCCKIPQIQDYKYDFTSPHNMFKDKISLQMTFKSRNFKVSHKISKKYVPEEIADGAIKQKAFNYYLDKNFVFTYFEGDNHFLYIFFEMSVLELVNIFRSIIKSKHQQSLDKKKKKVPLYKQLCETQFEDFVQYIKFQADFEIHFSYHNSLKQIFTHCDTKVFPIEYDKKHAYFQVKVNDTFDKVATYKLDNKMGMSQSIDDLYLLDFVLKDRDRFIVMFSGFIYARKATQKERESLDNYFQFADNQIKIIESKQQKYIISFTIVQQMKKNLMLNVKLTIFA